MQIAPMLRAQPHDLQLGKGWQKALRHPVLTKVFNSVAPSQNVPFRLQIIEKALHENEHELRLSNLPAMTT
jgi:hypothetical protein